MAREQFTFYRSFWEAAKLIKKQSDRLSFLEAIIAFGIDEEERKTTEAVASNFLLVKPTLLASAKKAKAGKAGGSAKQTGSKPEANDKQTGREKEGEDKKEGEKEVEKEKENECSFSLEEDAREESPALAFFLDRLNPSPSSTVIRELMAFREKLGEEVTLHALHIAVDERKTAWSYIRAILRRYEAEGLTDLAAVLASETKHDQQRQRSREMRPYGGAASDPDKDAKAMEQVRRLREKMRNEATDDPGKAPGAE